MNLKKNCIMVSEGIQVHGSLPRVTQITKEIQTFSFENLTVRIISTLMFLSVFVYPQL